MLVVTLFILSIITTSDNHKKKRWEPQTERCRIGGGATQSEWYFFSHKDRKYPTGSRTNRATSAGFWKATGRDKCIRSTCSKIGMRKTLVFYRGRAPHGQKTDWIMHEYRLHDPQAPAPEDGWVVCRVFRKKCFYKIIGSGGAASNAVPSSTAADRSLAAQYFSQQQILQQAYSSTAAALYKPELGLQYYPQLDLLPAHRGVTGYHDFSVVSHECDLLQEVGGGMEVMDNLEERFGGVVEHMNALPQQCDMDMALWGYGSRRD